MTSSTATIGKIRLDWIEWVRGIAATIVLIHHFLVPVWPEFVLAQKATADIGRVGVVAFFLVSGFVVPLSYRHQDTRTFIVRRFTRLYPVYWVVLLVAAILTPRADWSGGAWWAELLLNATMLQGVLGVSIVGAAWTLTIEIFYYMQQVAFKTIRLLDSAWMFGYVWLAVFLAAIAAEHVLNKELPVTFPLLLAVACIGHALSLAYGGLLPARRAWTFTVIVIVGLSVGGLLRAGVDEQWPGLLYTCSMLAGMALFGAAYLMRERVRLRWAVWLGSISYALYLTHDVALGIIKAAPEGWGWPAVAVATIAAFASAWLLHRYVEKPSIRLGRSYQSPSSP